MKIEQLYYLEDISKTQSITQSAQRFFLSQQASSYSIAKLEEEFSCPLIERSNKGVVLTPQGEELLIEMYPLINKYKSLKEKFMIKQENLDKLKRLRGNITIESHVRTLENIVIDAIRVFKDICPNVNYKIVEKENVEIITDVANENADIGIIFAPDFILNDTSLCQKSENAIEYEKLFSDNFVVCAHKDHPITSRKSIHLKELLNYDMVLFDAHEKMNKSTSPLKSNQIYSKDISFHKRLLLEKKVISTITLFEFRTIYQDYNKLTVLPIEEALASTITIVFKKEKLQIQHIKAFYIILKKMNINNR